MGADPVPDRRRAPIDPRGDLADREALLDQRGEGCAI